ncbi:MAG: hypothetical protein BWK76_07520 [Desulfobulbaceae bacterium A2]|nr:MAG: hypothetical protein BWK76_07520 [Desulfobulbaceae bacterium A2]
MITRKQLAGVNLFRDATPAVLREIGLLATRADFAQGEYIYRRGQPAEGLYILLDGSVEICLEEPGRRDQVVGQVDVGGHFGEVALLTDSPRFFSARAITSARVAFFDRQVVETKLLADPAIHRIFDKSLAERVVLVSMLRHGEESGGDAAHLDDIPLNGHVKVCQRQGSSATGSGVLYEELEFTRKLKEHIARLAGRAQPVLIIGETGAGRRLVAQQMHMQGGRGQSPYMELDIRQFDPWIWEGKFFGSYCDDFPFSKLRKIGVFEQAQEGTVVIHNADLLSHALQNKIVDAVLQQGFKTVEGQRLHPLRARLVFISGLSLTRLRDEGIFLPRFLALFPPEHVLTVPPLRDRKRDIPVLIQYYLEHYAKEYGKKVSSLAPEALGLLLKYDWPGNLSELGSVIQRAVIASRQDEILSEQILLGLPRSEGKMVYNLLRFAGVRRFFTNRLYPDLPRLVIMVLFFLGLFVLFFGPQDPARNIGITVCWYIGWPLLVISFFFLPRLWCSVCALSTPGAFLQKLVAPTRKMPPFIANHSRWIMALLCFAVFWVEIVWNAYDSPRLTAWILLAITAGSLTSSVLFQRSAWCRYLCPLGALNGIFSMPSILELRANRHLCDNQCEDHACYRGTAQYPGCPMFRHPFLVDNNRDCILCGRCIKNCKLQSIQLNLRFAPHELWMIQTPSLADAFLVIGLAAIFFPLTHHEELRELAGLWQPFRQLHPSLSGSVLFWGLIVVFWLGYWGITRAIAAISRTSVTLTSEIFAYGLIPLVLASYLAEYLRLIFNESWRLVPNLLLLFGVEYPLAPVRLLSEDGMTMLLHLIILGGMACSLYAERKIMVRLVAGKPSLVATLSAQGAVVLLGFLFLRYI